MIAEIRPETIYPESRLFLDYASGRESATSLFSSTRREAASVARFVRLLDRPRVKLSNALSAYNERLAASAVSMTNADALSDKATLCVIGGQQAGFLGGPLYALYKIVSVVRVARDLAKMLEQRVVPVFWLATEDHDLDEVNRVVFLEDSGDLKTYSFDWPGRGRPIEQLPITPEVAAVAREVRDRFDARDAWALFEPSPEDDYSTWHARIWSRLFADDGLVLVEPRTIRPLAGAFFESVLSRGSEIGSALADGAQAVRSAGYAPLLDPSEVGRLFRFADDGRRVRVESAAEHLTEAAVAPERYSADVALRPLLADRLFPTIANVLGPSELAYHALLAPLYELLATPQPVAVPRSGYTLLAEDEAALLQLLDLSVEETMSDDFHPSAALERAVSPGLRGGFATAKADVDRALRTLLPDLRDLDPGLEARWRQTAAHAEQALDRLEERARRADLARHGISTKLLVRLRSSVRPTGRPQERVLSFAHAVARHGVEWIGRLPGSGWPDEFAHRLVTLKGER
jgi:bacillithiol biosynthesis cysteine-adding enzyme BshC